MVTFLLPVPKKKPSHETLKDAAQPLLERLSVLFFCFTEMGQVWSWVLVLLLLATARPLVVALLLAYLAYAFGPGMRFAESQSLGAPFKRLPVWRYMRSYFSARLIRTVELDPQKRYIFTMHPHGIAAAASWLTFATDATGFSQLFPGLRVFCMTLASNFRAPLIREYALLCGARSVSRRSCAHILAQDLGNSIAIAPGGAAESLLAAPGTYDLILARRKGFVRVALQTGACLVPVINFGEPELFETWIPEPGSRSAKLLRRLHKVLGLAFPVFWGVGLFAESGILPRRRKLTTVVGAPLDVPRFQGDEHSPEFAAEVEKHHARYTLALLQLWDTHKDAYAPERIREMRMVE